MDAATHGRLPVLAVCALALCACADESDPTTPSSAVSYYRDVKPILDQSCVSCHQAGQIGVGLLDSYEEVAARAPAVKAQVVDRIMPPWHASDDCRDYHGDRTLSDAQIALIAEWVDAGAPAGDPADAIDNDADDAGGLSRIDVTLALPVAYEPSAARADDYRCFPVDWPEADMSYVTGIAVRPGNASTVHHVIAYYAGPEGATEYEALDEADPGPGYECYGGPGGAGLPSMLATWAPGAAAGELAGGAGIAVEGGSKVIIQVHYNTVTWDGAPDTTAIDFKVDAEVDKVGWFQFFTNPQWPIAKTMVIPAGEPNVQHAFSAMGVSTFLNGGQPFTVYGAGLHMHTRGTTANIGVTRAEGGDECLLDIPRWDFNWQGGYALAEPVTVQPGDGLYIECRWDNSTTNQPSVGGMPMPPSDLNWGEGTNDEMCLGGLFIVP